ncbi:spermine synthase, partial [Kibdelosporangium lantanae]
MSRGPSGPGRRQVRFGTAELMRDLDRPNGWLLSVDGVAQSYVDLDDPTYLDFEYVRRMGDIVDGLPPGP